MAAVQGSCQSTSHGIVPRRKSCGISLLRVLWVLVEMVICFRFAHLMHVLDTQQAVCMQPTAEQLLSPQPMWCTLQQKPAPTIAACMIPTTSPHAILKHWLEHKPVTEQHLPAMLLGSTPGNLTGPAAAQPAAAPASQQPSASSREAATTRADVWRTEHIDTVEPAVSNEEEHLNQQVASAHGNVSTLLQEETSQVVIKTTIEIVNASAEPLTPQPSIVGSSTQEKSPATDLHSMPQQYESSEVLSAAVQQVEQGVWTASAAPNVELLLEVPPASNIGVELLEQEAGPHAAPAHNMDGSGSPQADSLLDTFSTISTEEAGYQELSQFMDKHVPWHDHELQLLVEHELQQEVSKMPVSVDAAQQQVQQLVGDTPLPPVSEPDATVVVQETGTAAADVAPPMKTEAQDMCAPLLQEPKPHPTTESAELQAWSHDSPSIATLEHLPDIPEAYPKEGVVSEPAQQQLAAALHVAVLDVPAAADAQEPASVHEAGIMSEPVMEQPATITTKLPDLVEAQHTGEAVEEGAAMASPVAVEAVAVLQESFMTPEVAVAMQPSVMAEDAAASAAASTPADVPLSASAADTAQEAATVVGQVMTSNVSDANASVSNESADGSAAMASSEAHSHTVEPEAGQLRMDMTREHMLTVSQTKPWTGHAAAPFLLGACSMLLVLMLAALVRRNCHTRPSSAVNLDSLRMSHQPALEQDALLFPVQSPAPYHDPARQVQADAAAHGGSPVPTTSFLCRLDEPHDETSDSRPSPIAELVSRVNNITGSIRIMHPRAQAPAPPADYMAPTESEIVRRSSRLAKAASSQRAQQEDSKGAPSISQRGKGRVSRAQQHAQHDDEGHAAPSTRKAARPARSVKAASILHEEEEADYGEVQSSQVQGTPRKSTRGRRQ